MAFTTLQRAQLAPRRAHALPSECDFNTYAGKIEIVPTISFILKWVRGEVGAMKLDENLSEISLIIKDAASL
jgi:uncharacterized membrane protein YqiK